MDPIANITCTAMAIGIFKILQSNPNPSAIIRAFLDTRGKLQVARNPDGYKELRIVYQSKINVL